jgi:hypothetical protein
MILIEIGAPTVTNLGTGTPQITYILEQAMMPIGRAAQSY